jgi:hypothetical protein
MNEISFAESPNEPNELTQYPISENSFTPISAADLSQYPITNDSEANTHQYETINDYPRASVQIDINQSPNNPSLRSTRSFQHKQSQPPLQQQQQQQQSQK